MALSQRLQFRQTQSLVMTPQLMQAIKLLQMSHLDLAAYVDNELEQNPLLERADAAAEAADDGEAGEDRPAPSSDWLAEDLEPARADIEARLGTELGNVFPDEGPTPAPRPAPAGETGDAYVSTWSSVAAGGDADFEAWVAAEPTLHEHLEAQMLVVLPDARRRLIARHLIDLVDEAGYLAGDPAEIAARLGASEAEVEAVLALLQTLEPTGVCARNLRECLAIQLRERDRLDPAMAAMLDRLDLVARRDLAGLRRACGVDDEDVAAMIAEIRALTPKPGLLFGGEPVRPVVPDVILRAAPEGGFIVELNPDTLPRVLVNQAYHARIVRGMTRPADRAFLSEALQTANWLTRSLDQRAKTILKVAGEIVRQQDAFFALGVEYLRPLTLKAVADAIEMHESTVSRVTSNKYLGTPRGVFEMKYFFTTAIASAGGGDAHSAEAVRHRIRQLIEAEGTDDILSDDAIVALLKSAGIDIARRTVAKYREAMRIGSSVERRREKRGPA